MPQGRRRHKKESRGFKPWQQNRPDKIADAESALAVEFEAYPDLYARKKPRRCVVVSVPQDTPHPSRIAIESVMRDAPPLSPRGRSGKYAARVSFNRRRKHKGTPRHVARLFDESRPKRGRSQSLAEELADFNRWLAANGIRRAIRQKMILDRAAKAILRNPKRSSEGVDWTGKLRKWEEPAFELSPDRDGQRRGLSYRESVEKGLGGPHISERIGLQQEAFAAWRDGENDEPEAEFCGSCGGEVRHETTLAGLLRVICGSCGAYEVGTAYSFLWRGPIVPRVGLVQCRRFFEPASAPVAIRPRYEVAERAEVAPFIGVHKPRGNHVRGQGKWQYVIDLACKGVPFPLPIPDAHTAESFARHIRSTLVQNRATCLVRWSVTTTKGSSFVKVAPIGGWDWAAETRERLEAVGS